MTYTLGDILHYLGAMRRISPCIWFNLNILLLLWQTRFGVLLRSQSSLCEFKNLPCVSDNPDMCQMKYYKLNSTECRDMSFDDRVPSKTGGNHVIGNVELKSYYYNLLSFKMTAFNITFSHIKWKHMKFRFRQIGNDMKNTCREFFIFTNSTVNDLFYDCIWSNERYEGKPFFFEYEASNEISKAYERYSFHVPFAKNVDEISTLIKDWETFTYVEAVSVSNGLGPTTFFLYWQPLPKKFSVNLYNISVWSNDTGSMEVIHSKIVKCNNSIDCTYIYSKWYGTLQFGVQPISPNVICFTTTSLFFQVGGERAKPLLIAVICATFIVPVAFYVLYMMRKYMAMKEIKIVKKTPKLLFIYSPLVSAHVSVVLNLAEYLKNHCCVEPLVDELHIFTSKSRDPFKWCNESFRSADYVMVVASPSAKNQRTSGSVYKNTDVLLLRFLRERLSSRHIKTKFFVLMLPYNTDKDIPQEARNLRRFYFPRDLNKILRFLHENRAVRTLFGREVRGGRRDYKLHGKKLSATIDNAQQFLKMNKMEAEVCLSEPGEIDSDHELLAPKIRNPSQYQDEVKRQKECLREIARESFLDYPGPIEGINLLGGDEEENIEEDGLSIVHLERAVRNGNSININDLNL